MSQLLPLFIAVLSFGATAFAVNPTIQTCLLAGPAIRPGYGVTATFRWDAQPLAANDRVFVHMVDAAGKTAFVADHEVPVPTTTWTGRVTYSLLINAPPAALTGQYKIRIGMWNPATGSRQTLIPGTGVVEKPGKEYEIGTLQVSPSAPLPKLAPPTLDLSQFNLTFEDNFTTSLSVSSYGPGTRWIAHMPDYPDFGDGTFADPVAGFPFNVSDGMLRITATKKSGAWKYGLLSSVDPNGTGFSQQYGYFEMQAKLPKGEGVWPAFWLMRVPFPGDEHVTRVEIDVLEQYGIKPNTLNSTVHLWGPADAHRQFATHVSVAGMTDDFHRYGALIDPDYMTFFFDGSAYFKCATPPEAKVPLYLLVHLATGGGYSTANTPDPSTMVIDYVRAYQRKP